MADEGSRNKNKMITNRINININVCKVKEMSRAIAARKYRDEYDSEEERERKCERIISNYTGRIIDVKA